MLHKICTKIVVQNYGDLITKDLPNKGHARIQGNDTVVRSTID